jgi:dimethylhistidine N-methyltransferase
LTAIPTLSPDPRFVLLRADSAESDFAADVRRGLTADRKWLPPKWFYDELGSALFDAICFLPEYYVMRAEREALTAHAKEIVDALGAHVRLVELGSGTARKTRILLDTIMSRQRELEYVPVDVDGAMLERTSRELLNEYANLRITAVHSDFSRPSLALATLPRPRGRTVVLFLGSTIGNLEPHAAEAMLGDLRSALRSGDVLLLGVDLRKDRAILEPAYDDALGVTASFNLNLLQRINRELGGQFELSGFAHRAFYDAEIGRIEMHLVSRRVQRVRIDALDLEIAFDEGESIHTESSYKQDARTLEELATGSGFTVARTWTDARKWFADALLIAS